MIPRTKYVAGEVLDMKIYDCTANTAQYGQQTYIQQITPDFDIETLDQQVWVQGKISMYRASANRQVLVYAALDVSTDGFTTDETLCSVTQTMDSGAQTYASYQFSHIHVPTAVGTHAYRIRLYSPSNETILLGLNNNNGCQMTFVKKHMPAARLTVNTVDNWTFNTTPP